MNISQEHIILFRSLFQGRNDVYAVRWEKDGKSGYMPDYKVDWSDYKEHKAGGGSFKDYKKKEYLPFNEDAVLQHIEGRKTVGIYPLLEDNTSWFIAADFDETNWKESILKLHSTCQECEIPAYIERSRSGNGGHLWIFFEENLPAEQTRKLMFELLKKALIISSFEKEPSFDRLFPNQDFHAGKGLGNLIALPLNGLAMLKGNSVFLEPNTFIAYNDQFDAISNFQRLSTQQFKEQSERHTNQIVHETFKSNFLPESQTGIEILISNQVYLKRYQLNQKLIVFLRDNLNFLNSDYLVKKNIGRSTYKTEKYFRLIDETADSVIIPREFVSSLVHFCKQENIPYKIIDHRRRLDPIEFDSSINLLPNQEAALEKVTEKDFGVIVSPPGSGKTIIGLEIIVQKKQPALIIVHRQQLFDQWIDRIQSFLKIPKSEIGQIGNQKIKLGEKITIAMIQSLTRCREIDLIANRFGTIIVDECPHVPAKSFREAIVRFNSFYLYGLTATPKRKNNDEKLIFIFIGNILFNAEQKEQLKQNITKAEINIRETNLYAPFDYKIDKYETISRILIHDTQRNSLIIDDIEQNAGRFRSILVLTERKAHVEILNLYLKDKLETITIDGDDSEQSRKSKLGQLRQGHFKIAISTGQYFGEGVDLDSLECLFIVYPFAFEGKLIQYIGRIQRSGKPITIFDYRDSRIDYFNKMFMQRNRYYKKLMI